jgi:hypothetical protein
MTLSTKLVDGRTVSQFLEENDSVRYSDGKEVSVVDLKSPAVRNYLARAIAGGIDYAHSKGASLKLTERGVQGLIGILDTYVTEQANENQAVRKGLGGTLKRLYNSNLDFSNHVTINRAIPQRSAQEETKTATKPLRGLRYAGAAVILLSALLLGPGCGDRGSNGGGGPYPVYPTEHDDLGTFASPPSEMYNVSIMDFLQNNLEPGNFNLSGGAASDLDTIMNYFTGDDQLHSFGSNGNAIFAIYEHTGANPQGYTDSNGNGTPDFGAKFDTSVTDVAVVQVITQASIDEITNTVDYIHTTPEVQDLIRDFFVHYFNKNHSSTVTEDYDWEEWLPNVEMGPGPYGPVTYVARMDADIGTDATSCLFVLDPAGDTLTKVNYEKDQNGQVAGTTYTYIAVDGITSTDSLGKILQTAYNMIKYHEDTMP